MGLALVLLPVVFAIGFALGGLVEMAAQRLPSGQPILARLTCPHCGAAWSRWSWIVPRRCASCGTFPVGQLALQLLAGLTVTTAWLRFLSVPLDAFRVALFGLLLWLIARIDWTHHLIYLVTVLPSVFLVLGLASLSSRRALVASLTGALGAAALFALFYALGRILYRRPALGSGDILLAGLIGAMTGFERALPALMLGMLAAAVAAIVVLLRRAARRSPYLPYGAYLAAGAVTALLIWGPA